MRKIFGDATVLTLADIQPKAGMITAFICDHAQALGLPDWQEKAGAPARFHSLAFLLETIATGNEGVIIYETPFIFATSVAQFTTVEWQLWKKGLINDGDLVYQLNSVSETDCGFASIAQFGPF